MQVTLSFIANHALFFLKAFMDTLLTNFCLFHFFWPIKYLKIVLSGGFNNFACIFNDTLWHLLINLLDLLYKVNQKLGFDGNF